MAKVNMSIIAEMEYIAKLDEIAATISSLNGTRYSRSAVVELLLSMVDDLDMETTVVGYWATTFKDKRKDGRYKEKE